jgi:ABC-type bacteriocin/lantibiotic exporter with double-glycine peptidase domain
MLAVRMAKILPVPHFRQSPGLCGASALRAALAYWGQEHTEQELAELSGSDPDIGVEAPGLVEAAKKIGFNGFYHDDADLDDLARYLDLGLPVIVNWWSEDEGHFSVVVGMDDKYVYMVDPEKNVHYSRVSIDDFSRNWFDFKEPEQRDLTRRRLVVIAPAKIA